MKRKERVMRTLHHAVWLILITLLISAVIPSALAAPAIRKAEYEGKGRVEVDFKTKVQYKNLSITVKDSSGKKYAVRILDKDQDDVEFKILNYKTGRTYTYIIKGIRRVGEIKYASVTGKIKIPKSLKGIPLKEVEYDAKDREFSIEFDTSVQWKNPKVVISDGKVNYVRYISEKSIHEIEVKVKALTPGVRYTYTISGIRKKGTTRYLTISDSFVAPKK